VSKKTREEMRTYWDERARINAVWYVDTSLDFEAPDMDRFFETGRRIVAEALDGAPVTPPGRALAVEIGSGLGRVCLALAERFDRVVGIDISSEMVRRASEIVADDRVVFEVGDGTTIPLADSCADLVLSFTVFQHIPDLTVIEGYVAEASRVLRPEGVFVFQWNNIPGAAGWAFRRRLLAAAHRIGLKTERHGRNAPEFLGSRVPLGTMQAALERNGLVLRRTKGLGTLFAWAWACIEGGQP
jgi:SAM-dependent methyltransferase